MTRTLGRAKDHRESMLNNLGRSLVLTETVTTTLPKAKELRRLVDRWVNRAKVAASATGADKLSAYRKLLQLVHDEAAAKKLMAEIAPRVGNRTSGFTRVHRMVTRAGDAAPQGRVSFVDVATSAKKTDKPASKETATAAPTTKEK